MTQPGGTLHITRVMCSGLQNHHKNQIARRNMKDGVIVAFKDWMGLALLGIGIQIPAHHFLGGLVLALSGASFARAFAPEQNRAELWVVLLGAFLVAVATASVSPLLLPGWPVQVLMMAGGFLSRYIAGSILRMAGVVEKRATRIVDRGIDMVLPGKDGEDKP